MKKKSVYIAYTGGTIGMQRTLGGFAPKPGYFVDEIYQLPELKHPQMPDIVIQEYENLIDSANITPECWQTIADDIASRYDEFDGFVILHGTDTMAYSASMLSFMLENLAKPVIFTGSQIPLLEIRSDARENLIGAIMIAGYHRIPEVGLYFHNQLFRGNRAKKIDASGFSAFGSPNFPPLATSGTQIHINSDDVLKAPRGEFAVQSLSQKAIATLPLFPSIQADLVKHFLAQPMTGLILQTYGSGNAPINDKTLMNILADACERGLVIINCTQCLHGYVDMDNYEAGKKLSDIGIISGFDMTVEAALCKLLYLTSKTDEVKTLRREMQKNLRGELTKFTTR